MTGRTRSTRPALRPSRSRSYREAATDDSSIDSVDDQYTEDTRSQRRGPLAIPSPRKYNAIRSSRKRKANGPRPLGAKRLRNEGNEAAEKEDDASILGGKVPLWQTLPYDILLNIFQYAAHPLWTDRFQPTPSITWLLNSALLCRAFAEPALSALYYSPPLYPPTRAHNLLKILASEDEKSMFRYGRKIKYLEMEALSTLARKYNGHEPVDLGEIINYTPQLRGVAMYLLTDVPFFHKANTGSESVKKAVYQYPWIQSLDLRKASLVEWRWNSSIAGQNFSLPKLKDIHQTHPFQSLESLTLVNYESRRIKRNPKIKSVESLPAVGQAHSARDATRTTERQMADALTSLPRLKRLAFKMSSIVNETLLPLLPQHLEYLEITGCSSITSDTLDEFLTTHGRNIRELVLDHNQALNLSFLVDFATNCPKVEVLKMDLTYYNSHYSFQNSGPNFSVLLDKGETPTWPSSLQRLELFHLRKWNMQTADLFFSSLVVAAASLPSFRVLDIKASLDESSWRDRIGFRDKWTGTLKKVFLRKCNAPSPHFNSIDTAEAYLYQHKKSIVRAQEQNKLTAANLIDNRELSGVRRRSSSKFKHVEIQDMSTDGKKEDGESDTDGPLISTRRTTRQSTRNGHRTDDAYKAAPTPTRKHTSRRRPRRRAKCSNDDSSSSSEDSAMDDDSIMESDTPSSLVSDDSNQLYIQGMCDVVHVLIDNLRPTEEHLTERNFLDEEVSGDDDWVGDDAAPGDGGYAW